MSFRRSGLVWMALALSLASAPGTASTTTESAVAEKLRKILESDLEKEDAQLVPNTNTETARKDGPDDPTVRKWLSMLSRADVVRLRQAAEQFAAGEYDAGGQGVLQWGFGEISNKLQESIEEKLDKRGAGLLVFKSIAAHGDSLKAIGRAILDPRRDWCEVADVAWERAKTDIQTASVTAAETLAREVVNYAVGGGSGAAATLGVSPGHVYVAALELESEYFRGLGHQIEYRAGNRLYQSYAAKRRRGVSPDAAYQSIEDSLVTGSRVFSSDGRLSLGSDAYSTFARAYPDVRKLFESCYPTGDLLFCLDHDVTTVQKEARKSWCDELRASAQPTRGALLTVEQRLGVIWKRLGGTPPPPAPAGVADQGAIDAARQPLDDLDLFAQSAENLCQLLPARLRDATASCQALHDLEARTRGVDDDLRTLSDCRTATSGGGPAATESAPDLARRVEEQVAAADAASTAACDFAPTTSLDAARASVRQAADGGARVRAAAQAARSALARLEQLRAARESRPTDSGESHLEGARQRLRGAIPLLSESSRRSASCRATLAAFDAVAGRIRRTQLLAEGRAAKAREALRDARGEEARHLQEQAERRLGSVGDCSARLDAAVQQLSGHLGAPGEPANVASSEEVLSERFTAARETIERCPPEPATTSPSPDAIESALAAARAEIVRLEADESAAEICVGAALDQMRHVGQPATPVSPPSPSTAGGAPPSVAGGWQAGPVRTTGGTAGSDGDDDATPWIQGAVDAASACRYGDALRSAQELGRRHPDHPWLSSNEARLRDLASRQEETASLLQQARSAALANDYKHAGALARRATQVAPTCMYDAVRTAAKAINDGFNAHLVHSQEASRQAAAALLPALLQVLKQVSPGGGTAAAPPAAAPRASGAPARSGGLDRCSTQWKFANAWSPEPTCTCPGYRWLKGLCVKVPGGGSGAGAGAAASWAVYLLPGEYTCCKGDAAFRDIYPFVRPDEVPQPLHIGKSGQAPNAHVLRGGFASEEAAKSWVCGQKIRGTSSWTSNLARIAGVLVSETPCRPNV